ncbi:MAG: SMC-Scp complex subunit ScpB [Acidobacteriaceae bacterium]
MSLKARIEAVIYAAEEPVTLAALASLFRDEALAVRAERLAAVPSEPAAPPQSAEIVEEPKREALIAGREVPEAEVVTPDFAGQPQPASSTASVEDQEREARIAQRAADREARDEIRRLVDELRSDYASPDRGLEIREVAGGYRMATRAEYHDAVRAFIKTLKPPLRLSLQALETLAVIAYKQPVTAPEIGEIRGVDTSGVLGSLIARKLITTAGRKQVLGRPILYKTTKEFLLRFGLKDLNELPSMEEFEKMAGELAEAEDESAAPQAGEDELPFAEDEAAEQAADEVRAEEAVAAESASEGEGSQP